MIYTWNEIKKIIKNNIKKIFLASLILGTILTAIIFFINNQMTNLTDEPQKEEIGTSTAYFQYYVERPDGVSYTNLSIIKEYFTREETLTELQNYSDISIDNIAIKEGEELIYFDDEKNVETRLNASPIENDNLIVLNMIRGEDSHLYTFSATSAKEQVNMEVVRFYFNLIANNKVPFYNDKNVYIFAEPQIQSDQVQIDENIEIGIESEDNSILIRVIASYILSFIIVLSAIIISSLYSQKIIYAFSYLWDENHRFFLYDKKTNNIDEFKQFINYPSFSKKVFITEDETLTELNELIQKKLLLSSSEIHSSLIDINLDDNLNELVLFVFENKTSRQWYKKQQKLLSIYSNVPVKIVQVNF